MKFDPNDLSPRLRKNLKKSLCRNVCKELLCLETLGMEFLVALLDSDGSGSDLFSRNARHLAEKLESCNMTLANMIAAEKRFDKCRKLLIFNNLILVSDGRYSQVVLRRFGIDRLRRLIRNNSELRNKFNLTSSKIKCLSVDQCIKYLLDFESGENQ